MKNYLLFFLCLFPAALFSQPCLDFKLKEQLKSAYDSCIEIHRAQYKQDFLKEEHSPLKAADIEFLQFYKADNSWWIQARYELFKKAEIVEFVTSSGKIKKYRPYAILYLNWNGNEFNLTVYQSEQLKDNPRYADYLFLPFTDLTNGDETYGGGRYIDLRTGDFKDLNVLIDFNKAYNPYCAFSGGYSCPVPPEANRLKIEIKAGEMNFTGEKKH
ncbi:MAG: DUF1684 domain-containing protein [Bacteroidia bacterium]